MRWVTLVVALGLVSGCSLIGIRGPGSRGVDCSDSRIAPTFDTVVAVGTAIGATAELISASKNCHPPSQGGGEDAICGQSIVGGALILVAVPYAVSALYGHTTVSSCHRYRRAHVDDGVRPPAPPE